MERVSLIGALLLLSECLFSVFKVYDKESLFEFQKKKSAQWIAKPFKGFSVYFVFKKLKKLKIIQLITKQKKLSSQSISKLVKEF